MQRYLVSHKKKIHLADFDPEETRGIAGDKEEARARLLVLTEQLEELQELMAAEHKHSIMVILQGMDTSGKDGVIRRVFEGANPQGVRVASFKVPTPIEIGSRLPLASSTNRLPARVKLSSSTAAIMKMCWWCGCIPWSPRRSGKNATSRWREFERLLVEEGTTILKFFLHISKEEQKQRLLDRLADPAKHWKFYPAI